MIARDVSELEVKDGEDAGSYLLTISGTEAGIARVVTSYIGNDVFRVRKRKVR